MPKHLQLNKFLCIHVHGHPRIKYHDFKAVQNKTSSLLGPKLTNATTYSNSISHSTVLTIHTRVGRIQIERQAKYTTNPKRIMICDLAGKRTRARSHTCIIKHDEILKETYRKQERSDKINFIFIISFCYRKISSMRYSRNQEMKSSQNQKKYHIKLMLILQLFKYQYVISLAFPLPKLKCGPS